MALEAKVHEFLQKPLIARLATIGDDGYPHVVPIWFDVDGDDLVFMTDRQSQKAKNAETNAKGAVTIGGDEGDGAGYLFMGDWTVATDTDYRLMERITRRYQPPEQAQKTLESWKGDDVVVMRLLVKDIVKVM